MVVSSSKRKRKDTVIDTSPEVPKRAKVHAQRKFAQGALGPPLVLPSAPPPAPIRDEVRPAHDTIDIHSSTRRPNTEDFLTFLCYRGTPVLPPGLDFFNNAPGISSSTPDAPSTPPAPPAPPAQPFIPFGVRKRALIYPEGVSNQKVKEYVNESARRSNESDAGDSKSKKINRSKERKIQQINLKMDKNRQHRVTVHALRRKYQEQKMAKLRAVAFSKISENSIRTRSSVTATITSPVKKSAQITQKQAVIKPKSKATIPTTSLNTMPKQFAIKRSSKPSIPIKSLTKRTMSLRSSSTTVKRVLKPVRKSINRSFNPRDKQIRKKPVNSREISRNITDLDNKVVSVKEKLVAKVAGNVNKSPLKLKEELGESKKKEEKKDTSSEYSSDDDKPLKVKLDKLQTMKSKKLNQKPTAKKAALVKAANISEKPILDKTEKKLDKKSEIIKIEKKDNANEIEKKLETTKIEENIDSNKTEKKINIDKIEKNIDTEIIEENIKINNVYNIKTNANKTESLILNKTTVKYSARLTENLIPSPTENKVKNITKVSVQTDQQVKELNLVKNIPLVKLEYKTMRTAEIESKIIHSARDNLSVAATSESIKAPVIKMDFISQNVKLNQTVISEQLKDVTTTSNSKVNQTTITDQTPSIFNEADIMVDSLKLKPESNIVTATKLDKKADVPKAECIVAPIIKCKPISTKDIKSTPLEKTETKVKDITKKQTKAKSKPRKPPVKKEVFDEVIDKNNEPTRASRPTRKTKEAATLYMELLGRKLTHEKEENDDTNSLDSYPELPNVKKTEQREMELKASAENKNKEIKKVKSIKNMKQSHSISGVSDKTDKLKTTVNKLDVNEIKSNIDPGITKQGNKKIISKDPIVSTTEYYSNSETPSEPESDLSLFETNKIKINKNSIKRHLRSDKKEPSTSDVTNKKLDASFSDSDEEPLASKIIIKGKQKSRKLFKDESQPVLIPYKYDEEKMSQNFDLATPPVIEPENTKPVDNSSTDYFAINTEPQPISIPLKNESSLNPSVEEAQKIFGIAKRIDYVESGSKVYEKKYEMKSNTKTNSPKLVTNQRSTSKNESDICSVGQEDLVETKCILGKCDSVHKPPINPNIPEVGLTTKDLRNKRRVNMSTEQIEKWLNESCFATDDIEMQDDFLLEAEQAKQDLSKEIIEKSNEINLKPKHISTQKTDAKNERKPIFQPRRNIISKSPKSVKGPAQAFSPDNELSVYSFSIEDNHPTPVTASYRRNPEEPCGVRPTKRVSTTLKAQQKLELKNKKLKKCESNETDTQVTSMSLPSTSIELKQNKDELLSVALSSEDPQPKSSIAVQCNFGNITDTKINNVTEQASANDLKNMETSTQTEESLDQEGHLFYIPLQKKGGDQVSEQLIQGVAVKLGTEGPDGPNQRVIMRAKLVTKSQITNRIGEASVNVDDHMVKNLLGSKMCADIKNRRFNNIQVPVGTVQPLTRLKNDESVAIPCTSTSNIVMPKNTNVPGKNNQFRSYLKSTEIPSIKTKIPPQSPSKNTVNIRKELNIDKILDAPTFYPSEKEFQDPIQFIEQISPIAAKYGLCRIVPPSSFKPECKVADDMRFTAYNQYVNRMMYRFGPSVHEMLAIKKYLATQSITLATAPWIGGIEIDLPRLYHTVQELGGLKEVIEKKKWQKVAEEMCISKTTALRATKLDDIYCKYLLPYDTLSPSERQVLLSEVETEWARKEALYRQKQKEKYSQESTPKPARSNGSDKESESESEFDSESDTDLRECTVKGRSMALSEFYRIARNTMAMWFKNGQPEAQEVEEQYWQHVSRRDRHVCVHVGSIDSSGGCGFPSAKAKNSSFNKHPWNLKVLTNNSGSVLRSLGPVMGVTVPTLHVGMVFSACCWYRDPHGLPWVEYLHTGANKIWYGIPNNSSASFRDALSELAPQSVLPQTIWLPSDSTMVPPGELLARGVPLSRTVQKPGEFIIVCPKAYTSSLCTGYTVSESVYYATKDWLDSAQKDFKDIQDSREPTMFSLEQLLLSIASDPRAQETALGSIISPLQNLVERERSERAKLREMGVQHRLDRGDRWSSKQPLKNVRGLEADRECDVCRANLFVSMVTDNSGEVTLCLSHAIIQLTATSVSQQNVIADQWKLTYSHSLQELQTLADKVSDRLAEKVPPKKKKR